jgi:plasmid stability protein
MGQLLIRNIPDDVLEAFKHRANSEGIATETLARRVIAQTASRPDVKAAIARMRELRAMTPAPLSSEFNVIRDLRDGDDTGD